VASVAQLGGELRAWRTVVLAVTGMIGRVGARMVPCTRLSALRWFGPACDWRVQNRRATGAGQLVKADAGTGFTVPTMTEVLTPVESTREQFPADERAFMVHLDATELVALVPTAGPLLLATLLTPSIVGSAGELAAGNLLVHVAAPAPDHGTLRTCWTWT